MSRIRIISAAAVRATVVAAIIAAAATSIGCTPKAIDMRPFADQTAELQRVVSLSGQATIDIMRLAEQRRSDDTDFGADESRAAGSAAGSAAKSDALAAQWSTVQRHFFALSEYAESLAALRESVDETGVAVNDAVRSLGTLANVTGAGGITDALAEAAAAAYVAIAERAAGQRQLESMQRVQEQVALIGNVSKAQLDALFDLIDSAGAQSLLAVDVRAGTWSSYYLALDGELEIVTSFLASYQELELARVRLHRLEVLRATPRLAFAYLDHEPALRGEAELHMESAGCETLRTCLDSPSFLSSLFASLRAKIGALEGELAEQVLGKDAAPAQDLPRVLAAEHERWMTRIEFIRGEMEHYAGPYEEYVSEKEAIAQQIDMTKQIVMGARSAISAWVAAHGDLVGALAHERGISLLDLVAATTQVRILYEDLSKER